MNYTIEDLDNKLRNLGENLDTLFINKGIKTELFCHGDNLYYRNKLRELDNSIYYICINVNVYYDRYGIAIKPIITEKYQYVWVEYDERVEIIKGHIHPSGKTHSGGRIVFDIYPDGTVKERYFDYDPVNEPCLTDTIEKIVSEIYEHPRLRINKRNNLIKSELLAKIWCPSKMNEFMCPE